MAQRVNGGASKSSSSSNDSGSRNASPYLTELVFEDPTVESVKHSLSEKQGIPTPQRRLTFPLKSSQSAPQWSSFADQIRHELHAWQAIVYVNGKTFGRLVQPTFAHGTLERSLERYDFTFRAFLPAKKAPVLGDTPPSLKIPVDSTFVDAVYTIQLFGRFGPEPLALPFRYRVSGREAATKVSLQRQKREYIRRHQQERRRLQECDSAESNPAPVEEIEVLCGSGFDSCVAVFSLREIPATLTSLVLSFNFWTLTTTEGPKQIDVAASVESAERKSDMEAVLHGSANAAEPKTKDFNTCKDSPLGKTNMNRSKKTKKKKTHKTIKNGTASCGTGSSSGSSYEHRLQQHSLQFNYGYASVASNRQRGSHRLDGAGDNNSSDQRHIAMVDEILQSINQGKVLDIGDVDGSEKQSVESPLAQDDVETSTRDGSSPDNADRISPMRTESDNSSGLLNRRMGEEAKKREQLVHAMNDFEDEDVYIRRNRSVGSLVRSGSGTPPTASAAETTVPLTAAQGSDVTAVVHKQATEKQQHQQGWRMSHGVPASPAASPHRLSFRSANGLLQANGDLREEHGAGGVMPPSAGHSRMTTAIATTAPYTSASFMTEATTTQQQQQQHYPQNDVDSGQQRNLALHALLQQMGSTYQPAAAAMTNLTHQMAAAQQQLSHQVPLGNIQVQAAMGHLAPHSMQSLYALAPQQQQQLLQGHHLGAVSTLPTVQGLHLGALLSQEQQQQQQQPMPVTAPEPMRNGREDIRKHKDDVHDDHACFYMKKTNDLDRFLTEATPMLSLDASLEPQKALDQLTLEDVWKFYYECSMLGKEIPLQGSAAAKENHCGPSMAYYLPYLSGIQIFTSEDMPYVRDASNIFLCDVDGWPPLMRMQYEQFEVNPPWFRLPLYDMVDELSVRVPELKQLKLKDLHPASWFCVAWYPLYRIPDAPLGTRFLTFHSFHPSLYSTTTVGRGGSVPLAVYGLEWYNMVDELWLDNIKVTKPLRSPSPMKATDSGRYDGINGGEMYPNEHHHWMLRIKELRNTAKTFARGLGFRRSTAHGMADANTHHHDFEYFYERN